MMREWINRLGKLDLRSLAVMRIATAILVLEDVAARLASARAFYTREGVSPLSELPQPEIFWRSPLHALNDGAVYQFALLGLLAVAALVLLVGFRTRLATFSAWFILGSLHERNTLILHSSDTMLRLILFWGFFLPWGRLFSLDARHNRTNDSKFHLAPIAYVLQVSSIYFFSALHKTGAEWRMDFTAVYYAVATGEFSGVAGAWLAGFPVLTKILTVAVIVTEFAAGLLLVPGRVRTLVLAALLYLQGGFLLFLNLGPFPFISAAALLGLLPPAFWNRFPGFRLPETSVAPVPAKIWQEGILAYFMLFVLTWNLVSLPISPYKAEPLFRETARMLHLDQNWAMFAPSPPHQSSWLTTQATLGDATTADIWNNFKVSENPTRAEMRATWGDWRWFKYLQNLRGGGRPEDSKRFAAYLCGQSRNAVKVTVTVYALKTEDPVERLPQTHRLVEMNCER